MKLVVCESTGERFTVYREYLLSKHWSDVKKRFKESKLYKGKCEICGSKHRLLLHHKTYSRIGKERLTDLAHICQSCHGELHEMYQIDKERNKYSIGKWKYVGLLRKRHKKKMKNRNR